MPAKTRPGLIREALLDGRVFWEPSSMQGFFQQWLLYIRNWHPFPMMCYAHRLNPLSRRDRRIEGIFQLLTGFTGTCKYCECVAAIFLAQSRRFLQYLPSTGEAAPSCMALKRLCAQLLYSYKKTSFCVSCTLPLAAGMMTAMESVCHQQPWQSLGLRECSLLS
jgi:hypothetical protein